MDQKRIIKAKIKQKFYPFLGIKADLLDLIHEKEFTKAYNLIEQFTHTYEKMEFPVKNT